MARARLLTVPVTGVRTSPRRPPWSAEAVDAEVRTRVAATATAPRGRPRLRSMRAPGRAGSGSPLLMVVIVATESGEHQAQIAGAVVSTTRSGRPCHGQPAAGRSGTAVQPLGPQPLCWTRRRCPLHEGAQRAEGQWRYGRTGHRLVAAGWAKRRGCGPAGRMTSTGLGSSVGARPHGVREIVGPRR